MKQSLKIALLGLVASLNLQGSPLPQNTPEASKPSAERVIEWARNDNVSELSQLVRSAREGDQDILWYRHPIASENITGVDFETLIDYNRSLTTPRQTKRIILGPNYSVLDLVAKYGTPRTMQTLLEIWAQDFPSFSFQLGDGAESISWLNKEKASEGKVGGIANMLDEQDNAGNPLATAAADGRLDMVKAIAESIAPRGTDPIDISNLLNQPAATFIRPGIFVFGGNALIFALLNKHFDVAQYLLDKGALPTGSSYETKKAFLLDLQDQHKIWSLESTETLKPLDFLQLIRDAKLVLPRKVAELIETADKQKAERVREEESRVLKNKEDTLKTERNFDFYNSIKDHNIDSVRYLISKYPTLTSEYSIKETVIGSDLRIAQFLYNEMLKQRVPITEDILRNWLYGAVISDSVDVFQWIVETLKFDIKNSKNENTLGNILPGSRIEAYLRKTGLFDVINRNRVNEQQAMEEKQRAAR